ncbi:helix-turn-helix domain-containing protein [Enterococcus sp. LJL128]
MEQTETKEGGKPLSLFSDKLSSLMKSRDMSDDELGNLVGVNRTTITRWRTGERSPKMEKLPEIASVFQVDPRIFIGEIENAHDILTIYSQLDSTRQEYIYKSAEQQLQEQISEKKRPIITLAAHSDDPNRTYSDEQKESLMKDLEEIAKKHNVELKDD